MDIRHNKKTKQEIMEMYPTGTYYLCADSLKTFGRNYKSARQISNARDILGIRSNTLIYAESGQGCLFKEGIWAQICDEHGNPLGQSFSEPQYEIY